MRYEDASSSQNPVGSNPEARPDIDALNAGDLGPASGNVITGTGTITGQAGADSLPGGDGQIVALKGNGGSDSSATDGSLHVRGRYGDLTVQTDGDYSYERNSKDPNGVSDVFTYTLADAAGDKDEATLTIDIRRELEERADAQQLVPGPDGVVVLPAGVQLSDIQVVGSNLVIILPDGSQLVIPNGAVFVPQLVIGDVQVPPTNLAALLIDAEPQPASGTPQSSGGNFGIPVSPLDPGIPLGDLIPPTELSYTPPEFRPANQIEDEEPEIFVQPDGQPASVAAVDSVDERGLPTRNGGEPAGSGESADGNGGNNSDGSETTTGTIIVDSGDDPSVVTITGVNGIPQPISVGLVVQGAHGTLTITGVTGDNYTYSYTLTDNTSGNATADNFSVSVTDNDGDVATATLRIDIIDDVPTARPDTDSIAAGEFGPATGNVITDAHAGDAGDSDTNAADTVGADDATLTAVTGFGDTETTEGGFVVQGQYGVLTIDAEGNYSYTRDPGTPGGVSDVFNYTLTDGDGDTSTTTLTISIGDLTVTVGENPVARTDDDAVPGADGNPGGTGDEVDAENLSGTLSGSGGDGALTFDLLTTGAPTGFTYVDGPNGSVLVQQAGVTVLTITVDASTGDYTVTQNAPIDHPAGSDENNLSFTINYNVSDLDGDSASGTLTINVDDDTPTISRLDVSPPTLTVDETDLATNASGDFSTLFGISFGADGEGSASYAVSVVNGTDSGLVDVATGDSIFLFNNNGVVEGRVGGEGGAVSFTVSVDSTTGVVTLDQVRALEHPNATDPDDPVSPDATAIQFTVNAVDGDGDPVSSTVNIGGNLVFEDDGPSVSGTANPAGAVTVDESGPTGASTIEFTGDEGDDADVAGSGPIGRAVGLAAVVDASAAFGADGPADAAEVTYALALGGSDTALTLTDGSAIELQLIDGVIVGVVTEGAHTGDAAFAIAIDPNTGIATVELYLSLDHPDVTDPNDSLPLGPNTVDVVVTATDGDGDSADSDPVDISGLFNFLDDGPSVDAAVDAQGAVTVDESGPTGASTIEFTGDEGDDGDVAGSGPIGRSTGGTAVVNPTALFGADGPAGNDFTYALALGGSDTALTLTDGSAIELQLIDGVIVGVVTEGAHDGEAAFAIAIDPNTGIATVELYLSLDHPDVSDHNDSLPLGPNTIDVVVTATDGDGDTADSDPVDISGLFNFLDDGPSVSASLSEAGAAVVDESAPVADATIETPGFTKGDDPHLTGGLAIGSGSTSDAVIDANALFGADGEAATNSLTYDLVILNAVSGLTTTEGVAINLVQLDSGVVVGVVEGTTTLAFAISINSTTGVVTVEQYLSLDHPDFPDNFDEAVFLGENVLGATVTATDGDGDTDTSDAVDIGPKIRFEDDGPSASDEAQQDVAEGVNTVSGTFDFIGGADGATVTHINGIALTFGGDGWSQWIPVDDGQIRAQADGDYQFESDASGSGVTSGTFTVTDGDGDQDDGNWAFNITDANAPTAGISAARLDDDGLANGNPLSTTGDIDANVGEVAPVNSEEDIFHGQLTLDFGGDGAGTVTFAAMHDTTGSVGTETVRYTWVGSTLTATVEGGARDGTVLFDIVVDQATGEYTLTLRDNVIHAAGGDETSAPNVALTYTVTDADNSPVGGVDGTLNITFNDDAPTLTNVQAGVGVDVDETDFPFPVSDTSAGAVITATQAFGADGAAAANSVTYGLTIVGGDGTASGLQTAVGDFNITLEQIDADTIEGHYNGSNVAFVIQINANGSVTLTQNVALEHGDDGGPAPTDHNDTLDLTGLINATITITDGDGDTATDSAPIGDNLVFFDDGPDAQVDGTATLDQLVLDETRPVTEETDGDSAPAGLMTTTANFANNFVSPADHGADGAGTVTYSLFLSAASVGSGLYALEQADTTAGDGDGIGQGAEIMLSLSGDGLTITGSVGLTPYFTISIDPATGIVTFTQSNNIWHGSTASDDDTATLTTASAANVQVVQTVTDSDGDFDTAAINVGQGVFHIEDDGPKFATVPDAVTVTNGDTTLQDDIPLNLDIGTDGFGLLFFNDSIDGDPAMDNDGNPLSFNGEPLFYQVNGNVLTLETTGNGDDVAATITLNTDGTYSFQLHGTISNGTETSFTDLTSAAAGNVAFRGVGTDNLTNNPDNIDILLSGQNSAEEQITVNTSSTSIGSGNQSIGAGETIRIDLVNDLSTSNPNSTGFSYDSYEGTTQFTQTVPQINGQPGTVTIHVAAVFEAVQDDTFGYYFNDTALEADELIQEITSVTIFDNTKSGNSSVPVGSVTVLDPGDDTPQIVQVPGGQTYTVIFEDDNTITIEGMGATDQYQITTDTNFNAILVNSDASNTATFDLGIFTIGTESSGDPIVQDFDIVAQDRDGDQETSTITTTIEPVTQTLAATSFAAQEEQLLKSAANSNTLTLAAAVAAAGVASMPAAAHHSVVDDGRGLAVEDSLTGNQHVGPRVDSADTARSALTGETKDAVDDSAPQSSLASASAEAPAGDGDALSGAANDSGPAPTELLEGTDAPAQSDAAAAPTAQSVAMPSAEMLQAANADGESKSAVDAEQAEAQSAAEVAQVVADALAGGNQADLDALLQGLPGDGGVQSVIESLASHPGAGVPAWDMGPAAGLHHAVFSMDMVAMHQDAGVPQA